MKEGIVSFSVFRRKSGIFVKGLPGHSGKIRVNKAILGRPPSVAVVGASYLEAVAYKKGIKVWLRRLKDDSMLFCWLFVSPRGSISYDPLKLRPLNAKA